MHKNNTYAGTSAGGRLGHKNNFLYLSLGDFYFDGVNEEDITSINESDYGKIIKISLKDMKKENFAIGLRNPQGMFIDKNGIFETEHAPQGGDELNFIDFNQINKDYGWPNSSFGVNYGEKIWPLDPSNTNYKTEGSIPPIMSWIPSIGISNLIRFYSKNGLSRWNEDLLISSLRDKSIYRIKLNGVRPILIEKIELGFRIRDLIQSGDKIYIQEAGSKYIWELKEKN
jgi:glucose/arabinose dehydrogenase